MTNIKWPPEPSTCGYGEVPTDYFMDQWKELEPERRFEAAARHAAFLFNTNTREKARLLGLLNGIVERLRAGDVPAAIALDAQALLDEENI
jgi:hypothetical protein